MTSILIQGNNEIFKFALKFASSITFSNLFSSEVVMPMLPSLFIVENKFMNLVNFTQTQIQFSSKVFLQNMLKYKLTVFELSVPNLL